MKPVGGHAAPRSTRAPDGRVGRVGRAAARLGTLRELVAMLGATGRWWLLPFLVVLLLAALLLLVVSAVEYVAPFVYTVF